VGSKSKQAVVLLSGGLDSATCLAIAAKEGYQLHCISFDYGQRHNVELKAAAKLADAFEASHQVFKIDFGQLGGSALTDDRIEVPDFGESKSAIPVTYVPARNTVFLSYGLAVAEVKQASDIFIGVNAVDYSGYPDCRPEFIKAFQQMANLATKVAVEGESIEVHTPLIHLSKAEIIKRGTDLGLDYASTVSCYRANEKGEACGLCDSCELRKQGFESAGVADSTLYV